MQIYQVLAQEVLTLALVSRQVLISNPACTETHVRKIISKEDCPRYQHAPLYYGACLRKLNFIAQLYYLHYIY